MRKYWVLTKVAWENGLVYRASILMWRFRQFLSTIMALTLWTVIFGTTESAFAYNQQEMITYIFLAAFLQSAIIATALNGLANTVYSGTLSQYLVKPVNLFAYFATEELADKVKNVGFLIVETAILFLIFQPVIFLPGAATLAVFLLWMLGGIALNFLVTLLFGAFGFWSPDVWGPRFLFFLIISFTAGKLFPLDILPEIIQKIIFLTPFPYFAFMQTQLFLEKLSPGELLAHSAAMIFWVVLFGVLVKWVWSRGLRNYASAGQ